jgi:hypothetical protein
MKILFLLITSLLSYFFAKSQTKIDDILSKKDNYLSFYENKIMGCKILYLPMEYGKHNFSLTQLIALEGLKDANVVNIDLVFTDYPKGINLYGLNKKRLMSLFKLIPNIALDNKITYNKIRQTGATNKEDAEYYPHGFYIYYRPMAKPEYASKEVKKIKKSIIDVFDDSIVTVIDSSALQYCSIWSFYSDTLYMHPLDSGFVRTIKKIDKKKAIEDSLVTYHFFESLKGFDSVYYVYDVKADGCDDLAGSFTYESYDTTVSKVLNRNKQWNTDIIISDVTGSMYPYTSQLLLWIKLKQTDNKKRNYLFFNDGDSKRDEEKILGSTGGIYYVNSSEYDVIFKTIERAMSNGGGGDAAENNLEALITAKKYVTEKDTFTMIADNWAPIKDYKLIKEIKNPVRIILCGVYDKINTDYLNLARDTKGSLHLIEEDIYNLALLKEGETIKIGTNTYIIEAGVFKELVKTRL